MTNWLKQNKGQIPANTPMNTDRKISEVEDF